MKIRWVIEHRVAKRSGLSFVIACVLVVGCKKDDAVTIASMPSGSASALITPIDHLATHELLEGDAKAFGLVLPRGVRIDSAFADVVYASGEVPVEGAKQYVRVRVREGKMIEGDVQTTFDHVRVPALPDKQLVIRVQPAAGAIGVTRFEVRDVTQTAAPNLPDDTARWAAAGLKPNGQPLDPTHLQ